MSAFLQALYLLPAHQGGVLILSAAEIGSRPRDTHRPRIWVREQGPMRGSAARRKCLVGMHFADGEVRQSSRFLAIPI